MRGQMKKTAAGALAAAFLIGTAVCGGTRMTAYADSIVVNSSSEIETGAGDLYSTAVVARKQVTVWEINRDDDLILQDIDLPFDTYRELSIGILYPQPDGSFALGLKEDGSFDYETGAGDYVSIDTDLNAGEVYDVVDSIRFHGELGGHPVDSCLYFLMFRYDRDGVDMVWTGDIFIKFVSAEELAHMRESKRTEIENEQRASEPAPAAPQWKSNDKGWWVEYPDGTYLTNAWYQSPESGLWYYMGADGYMLADTWYQSPESGLWYYMGADGRMLTDAWHQSPESGLWYYMGTDGCMLTDADTPDGYHVGADGVWIQ